MGKQEKTDPIEQKSPYSNMKLITQMIVDLLTRQISVILEFEFNEYVGKTRDIFKEYEKDGMKKLP